MPEHVWEQAMKASESQNRQAREAARRVAEWERARDGWAA